jgi:putative FmdB family regulatory protein
MPTYEYECELDGRYEREHPMGEAPASILCPVCGDDAKRKFFPALSIFKGSGWGGSK